MNTPITTVPRKCERLYGRRKGRPLNNRRAVLMQELLPTLAIDLTTLSHTIQPRQLFSHAPAEVWLEIGFGGGEHLAAQAERNPHMGFIGCESFMNGVAGLLDHVDRLGLNNVRVFAGDARLLLDALAESCLARCFVLFPDPWPKTRHAERRFIGAANLQRLQRVIIGGGELRLATDVTPLAEWMRGQLVDSSVFDCIACDNQPPIDWVATRYEQKGRAAGRVPTYLSYRRV